MELNLRYRLLLILCLSLIGCREPFEVVAPFGNSLLVVNGLITDQPGPYTIQLSRSRQLNGSEFPAESGATVTIESKSGASEVLVEETAGYYMSSIQGIQGQIGEEYRLIIETRDGKAYQSEWKLLKRSPPIDSLYYVYGEKVTENGPLIGLQTYVDTHDPENQAQYYRYEWTETWIYNAALAARWTYLGNDTRELFPQKRTCWQEEVSTTISLASSVQNQSDIISGHPILFVSTATPRLLHGYSLLVKQYALDREEYLFWELLKETLEETGTLFDKQPTPITGNIFSVGSNEPVLGYFSASTVSEQRIFLKGDQDLPKNTPIDVTLTKQCYDGRVYINKSITSERDIRLALERGLIFYDWVIEGGEIIQYIFTTPICSDCTVQGGTLEKPDYWP